MSAIKLVLTLAGVALAAAPGAFAQTVPVSPVIAPGQTAAGELAVTDTQRRSGKFEDVYVVEGHRGQRLQLDLASDAFDPYLVVTGPEGFTLANADAAGGYSLNSRIVIQFPGDGQYRVS